MLRLLRRVSVAALAFGALTLAGCNPNPFCLNCGARTDGGAIDLAGGPVPDLAHTDDAAPIDMTPVGQGGDGGCNGDLGPMPEVCNKIDDDCNGVVDDVDPSKLQMDPKNCGKCGNECLVPFAFGQCAAGMCHIGDCQPGHYNLDGDATNGCEFACIPTPPAKCKVDKDCAFGLPCSNGSCIKACMKDADCPGGTICDPDTRLCEGDVCDGQDNNCNGKVDEGFDLMNDVNNCGACNTACTFPNATGKCSMGMCSVLSCTPGYNHLDKTASGCEYKCPVFPPKAETCNGVDDDCDGVIDNSPSDVGGPCSDFCPMPSACVANKNCAFATSMCTGGCCGICTQGATICAGGQKVCQMGAGPKLEVCNGADDNCDGQIDEGFDLQNDPLNCGKCGTNCSGTILNAIAGCKMGVCNILSCKPGFADLDKNTANGCEYTCPVNPPTVETCNGKDDDCNGIVDDNLTQPNNFCSQTGPCAGAKPVCGGAKGFICNYQQVNPRIEVDANGNLVFVEMLCDNFDGNCNGQLDESFTNKGKTCSVGQGACAGTGTFTCDPNNAMQLLCPAVADQTKATDEVCNGLDDDCDGAVDERADGPGMCSNGGQHLCKGWRDPVVQVGAAYVYQYEASRVDATAGAAGTSNARACAKPGVLPWAPVTETQAAAACAAIVDSNNAPLRLCTASEWQAACNVGVMPPTQVWSYATNPTTYQSMVCNGADANIGKAWATGSGASCYAKDPNGNIYDMSGNVSEWTSTQVVYNNTTYYKVRGGAYNNPAGGMSCNFDFVIETASYQFNDIGFRCCADNLP